MLAAGEMLRNQMGDGGVHHVHDDVLYFQTVQHLLALVIDDLPLLVHDIVILQHGLTGLEVPGFHGGLGLFNGSGENLLLDGGVLVDVQPLHHAGDPVAAEQAHEIVLKRDVEPGLAGIALTAGTAAELVVDAAGVVALGADDEQAACLAHPVGFAGDLLLVLLQFFCKKLPGGENLLIVGVGIAGGLGDQLIAHAGLAQIVLGQVLGVAAQHDIRTTAGHVGGHGDGAELTGLGHNLRFLFVVFGVEEVVLDALPGEELAQQLVFLDAHGTHQYRLTLFMALLDLSDDGPVLACLGLIHGILVVDTDDRAVGGDLHDVQLVDGGEFLLLRQSRTGHTGELAIQAEIVLEGNGGQGLALPLDGHVLLGLDGLMQALGIAAAEHQAAGEFIHNDDLTVLDHIVHVLFHGAVGLDGLVDVVGDGAVFRVGQVFQAEKRLRLGNTPGSEGGGLSLLVHHIVGVNVGGFLHLIIRLSYHILFQARGELLGHVVELGGLFTHAGNNEGGTGLINEDGVHLIHDGKVMPPLHLLAGVDGHIVAQVVKAHLVVGAVGNVGGIGLLSGSLVHVVDDEAHLETQKTVDLAHPLRVTLGQIVVDGDDVHALAGEGVEVGGQGGHQGLALAGLHLGDAALVQHDTTDELHPVGAHTQHTVRRFPDGGKGLGEDVVGGLTVMKTLLELSGLGLELGIGERFILLLQRFDLVGDGVDLFKLVVAVCTEYFGEKTHIQKLPFCAVSVCKLILKYTTFFPVMQTNLSLMAKGQKRGAGSEACSEEINCHGNIWPVQIPPEFHRRAWRWTGRLPR